MSQQETHAPPTPATETHRVPVAAGQAVAVDWTPPAADGPGRCAVFVHGLGSHRRGDKARTFARRFADHGWGFLALDLRGHGDSDGDMRGLTLTRCLADLAAALAWLRERAGDAPPVLIGSSMGAAVVAWHTLAHERAVDAVAMIAPALTFPGRFFWQLGPEALEEWRQAGVRRFESDWIDLEIGFGLVEDATNYDPQKLLLGYATPTLIFHGLRDESVPWRGTLTFVEDARYPHLELVLLKQGDHRLTERKDFLFDTLWAWLQQRAG